MRRLFFFILILAILAAIFGYRYYTSIPKERDSILLFGNVDVRQVDLGFRVEGRVDSMLFEEGDVVEAGMLMGSLDPQPFTDLLQQAQSGLEAQKSSLQNAKRLLLRRQELNYEGVVSQEELENSLTTFESQTANVDSFNAAMSVAATNLSDTRLFAPSNGTILTRIREPGTVVRRADPIYTLSIIDPIWVRAFVIEPLLGLVYPGMPTEIYTDTPNSKIYKGHIGFISPVAEFTPKSVETSQLRTDLVYRLRVIVDNPDQGLRQGMPVTVRLSLQKSS